MVWSMVWLCSPTRPRRERDHAGWPRKKYANYRAYVTGGYNPPAGGAGAAGIGGGGDLRGDVTSEMEIEVRERTRVGQSTRLHLASIGFPRARTPVRSLQCAQEHSTANSPALGPITVPFLSQSANSAADRASGKSNSTLLLAVLST